jgi:hypothetical protein
MMEADDSTPKTFLVQPESALEQNSYRNLSITLRLQNRTID